MTTDDIQRYRGLSQAFVKLARAWEESAQQDFVYEYIMLDFAHTKEENNTAIDNDDSKMCQTLTHRASISSKKENIQYSRPVSKGSGRRGATSEVRVAAALVSRTGIKLIGWARRSTAAIMQ